jgi:hypothetical protein
MNNSQSLQFKLPSPFRLIPLSASLDENINEIYEFHFNKVTTYLCNNQMTLQDLFSKEQLEYALCLIKAVKASPDFATYDGNLSTLITPETIFQYQNMVKSALDALSEEEREWAHNAQVNKLNRKIQQLSQTNEEYEQFENAGDKTTILRKPPVLDGLDSHHHYPVHSPQPTPTLSTHPHPNLSRFILSSARLPPRV